MSKAVTSENSPRSAKKAFLASFHSIDKSRQHALCPDRQFHPGLHGLDLSALFSAFAHWRRLFVWFSGQNTSSFLASFAPRELPRFVTTMRPLTSVRFSVAEQISLVHVHGLLTILSPTTRRTPPSL